MSLRVVLGPMFAGKTSEIQSVVRRYMCLGKPVLVLTAAIDNRYQSEVTAIVNHDRVAVPAVPVAVDGLRAVLEWPSFAAAVAVIIDEAQFFRGCLVDFALTAVDEFGKHVVVVGLDGDTQREAFGDILKLIPLADVIEKKTALCRRCGDGTAALFTRGLSVGHEGQVSVGGAEQYEPVCRRHFLT